MTVPKTDPERLNLDTVPLDVQLIISKKIQDWAKQGRSRSDWLLPHRMEEMER